MFKRLTPETRRTLGAGFLLVLMATVIAMSENVVHGIGIGCAALLAVLVLAIIVQYGSHPRT